MSDTTVRTGDRSDSSTQRNDRTPGDHTRPRREETNRDNNRTDRNDRVILRGGDRTRDPDWPDSLLDRRRPSRDTSSNDRVILRSGDRTVRRSSTDDPRPYRNRAQDIFTRSAEGKRYQHGVILRQGGYIDNRRIRIYFPHGYAYYPYYCPTYDYGVVFYSPYYYYYGVCPPYIYRRHCYYRPPAVIYIEVPVYVNNVSRGYDSDLDDYYLSRNDYYYDDQYRDRTLNRAIDNLRDAFRDSNIDLLAELTDPNVRIAVFRRGKYEYTLEANDYLDMTRDMMRTTETIDFDLYRVRRRARDVYVVSGKHVYLNRDDEKRTVYVSFVLERLQGRWVLTQVGTAPDRIED